MIQENLSIRHRREVRQGQRFQFGTNWQNFVRGLTPAAIDAAQHTLTVMLGRDQWEGTRFLDVGSGSGIFSLAARRLGATVYSFDYDPMSVACTADLKQRYQGNDDNWSIEQGSVLDRDYLVSLGEFDIVYAWGVLHHTGAMWQALANVAPLVKPRGKLFLALYNDQGWRSRYWKTVKWLYNRHVLLKVGIGVMHTPLLAARMLIRVISGRLRPGRGMSLWYDYIDWLGGYPFEVAKPDDILAFYREKGFYLTKLKTCGGRSGCNEYVFERQAQHETVDC